MTDLTALTGNWTIDASHSRLGFVTRHAMVTKVRGNFTDFEGQAVIDGAELSNSSVNVVAKIASFTTGSEQRDAHVIGADFLDSEQYPTLSFTSTQVVQTGDETADITGDLTIKGQTRQITIPFEFEGTAVDVYGITRAGFTGQTTILRSEFGITWNAALETGGVMVADKVQLEIEISATKNA